MENRKNQTGSTYMHRLQDGTEAVIGMDPAGHSGKEGEKGVREGEPV